MRDNVIFGVLAFPSVEGSPILDRPNIFFGKMGASPSPMIATQREAIGKENVAPHSLFPPAANVHGRATFQCLRGVRGRSVCCVVAGTRGGRVAQGDP